MYYILSKVRYTVSRVVQKLLFLSNIDCQLCCLKTQSNTLCPFCKMLILSKEYTIVMHVNLTMILSQGLNIYTLILFWHHVLDSYAFLLHWAYYGRQRLCIYVHYYKSQGYHGNKTTKWHLLMYIFESRWHYLNGLDKWKWWISKQFLAGVHNNECLNFGCHGNFMCTA